MNQNRAKQISFIIFLIIALGAVMAAFLVTSAMGQDRTGLLYSDWDWDEDWGGSRYSSQFRYNRVEGVYLGVSLKRDHWLVRHPTMPFLYGSIGYGFAAKELQGQIGLEKGFFENFRMGFGAEFHRFIDTPDRWIISDSENSLAAFLLKEDFQDFYFREGASGYITQNFTRALTLEAAYHYEEYDSLSKNMNWSLFGKNKRFRENPPMSAGEIRSVSAKITVDSRNSRKKTTRGWYIQAEVEHAGNNLGGDFTFDRLLIDIRRYQNLGFGEGVDIRLRVGTSSGELPWQKSYHLGGLSTLRGFSYKAFPAGPMNSGGNRMVLAQLEYRIGSQDLPNELDLGILEHFNLILFTDVGWIGCTDHDEGLFKGFEELTWSSLKNDVGVAFANRGGNIRFEIIRRTDTSHKPFTFLFRLSRPF